MLVGLTTAFTTPARAEFSVNISLGFPFPSPRGIVATPPPVMCTPPVIVTRPPVVVAPCRPVVISRPIFVPPGHAKKYRYDRGHRHDSRKWRKGRH